MECDVEKIRWAMTRLAMPGSACSAQSAIETEVPRLLAAFTALEAENGRLREALKPFKTKIDELEDDADRPYLLPESGEVEMYLNVKHLRRARSALVQEEK